MSIFSDSGAGVNLSPQTVQRNRTTSLVLYKSELGYKYNLTYIPEASKSLTYMNAIPLERETL
jgi:hypothetical protein